MHNPRLTKERAVFIDLMNNLNLPYPKQIGTSVYCDLVLCACPSTFKVVLSPMFGNAESYSDSKNVYFEIKYIILNNKNLNKFLKNIAKLF